MNYTQISFKLNPDTEGNREILVAVLSDLSFESFDENDELLMGYIPGESFDMDEINGITSALPFHVQTGNEMIFANIHKNVIISDLPVYENVLQSGGKLYLSGFYTQDMPDVKKKAESLGLVETGFQEKNNWVVYSFKKA